MLLTNDLNILILSIKNDNFSRALRAFTTKLYTMFHCFRRVFREMCHFYTLYSYNDIAKSAGHAHAGFFDHFKHQSDKFSRAYREFTKLPPFFNP